MQGVRVEATRRSESPWPYFGVLVAATWCADLLWHGRAHAAGGVAATTVAWLLMTAAMMTPTTVPMLSALFDVVGRRESRTWWWFLVGYLAVWAAFGVAAAQLQIALARLGVVTEHGVFVSNTFAGVALLGAGAYQFTPLKNRCRELCMRPMKFFMVHWRSGTVGAIQMGVRHGVACLGCCAALMLLAFVGGMANWGFMALATAVMVVEKLPSVGRRITVPLGLVLLVAGITMFLVQPLDAPSHIHHHASTEGTTP